MVNESVLTIGTVNLEKIEEAGKENLVSSMRLNYRREMTDRISGYFFAPENLCYALTAGGNTVGIGLIKQDSKRETGRQIILDFFTEPDETALSDAINKLIGIISQDKTVEYISVKADENDLKLQEILVSMGFLKDGLFISNHQSGEFIYYTVYSYKLT